VRWWEAAVGENVSLKTAAAEKAKGAQRRQQIGIRRQRAQEMQRCTSSIDDNAVVCERIAFGFLRSQCFGRGLFHATRRSNQEPWLCRVFDNTSQPLPIL